MIFSYSLLIALSLLISVYTGQASNFIIPILFFTIGVGLIQFFADPKNQKEYTKLYSTAYLVYMFYAELCFFYMKEHNYSCLLVSDTITAYIPWVEDFMQEKSLRSMLELLYGNEWTPYKHAGIILLYWTAVGKFSTLFGYELYFNLQVSVFFLSAFVPVFLYRLLVHNKVNNPYKLSLIYSFCSVFCYYSTLILRDAPIALIYIIAFSYLFAPHSIKKNAIFISMIIVSYLIRRQMGLFLLLFFFISFITDKKKISATSMILLIVAGAVISYVMLQMDLIEDMEKNLMYAEANAARDSDGIVHRLNRLPPIISDITKIIYIHISPIPSWAFMGFQSSIDHSHNIMGFPRMFAVLYNYILLGFILFGAINYKRFYFTRQQTIFFLAALLFLALQSSSTEQRRLMICYPVLFIFAVMVFQRISMKLRKDIYFTSIAFFFLFQVLGFLKY